MAPMRINTVDMPSKLDAHLEAVISLRREGKAWTQIAAELDKLGIKTSPQNLWKWFQRRQRKAQKVARELRPFDLLARSAHSPRKKLDQPQSDPSAARTFEVAASPGGSDPFKPQPVQRIISADQPNDKPPEPEKFTIGDDIIK